MKDLNASKQYKLEEAHQVGIIKLAVDDEERTQPNDSFDDVIENEQVNEGDGPTHTKCTLEKISYIKFIPFVLSLTALALTGTGSWSCHYFRGATIVFTSARYGLWTLEDASGNCQLWDQLFFSFRLGVPLSAARFFSMITQLNGLALTTVMTQALQFHIGSWSILVAFTALLVISILTSGRFNLWAFFFLFTYIIFTLITRYLFIHPVHRRISKRGCKIISGNCALCSVFSFLTLIVLRSEYCTCNNIPTEHLEGLDLGKPCEGSCKLDVAGIIMICAGVLWGLTSILVFKIGVQPKAIRQSDKVLQTCAHYPRHSIVTRIVKNVKGVTALVRPPFTVEEGIHDNPDSDDETDDRSVCHKICCDYRITSRDWKEKIMFWLFRLLLGVLVTIYIAIILLKIKSFYENREAYNAPETSHFFTLEEVCAFNPNNTAEPFRSYPTKQDAIREGYKVAHCGECSMCSNPWDVKTYVETRKTIAMKAKKCAIHAVFGADDKLNDCLLEKIGFSAPCTECWTENLINTAKFCLYTCIKATLTGSARTHNVPGTGNSTVLLNQCIYCDEKMSGPEFVTCSGVSRRRLGVKSEIERNPKEQCQNTDVNWMNVTFDDLFPNINDPNLVN